RRVRPQPQAKRNATRRPPLLPREGEFPGRVARLQRGHFAIFHDELIDDIRELRRPELETLEGNQLDGRSAREGERKTRSELIEHFKFNLSWSHVSARELFEQRRIKHLRLARTNDFGLIQRDHCVFTNYLRMRTVVIIELAMLYITMRTLPVYTV